MTHVEGSRLSVSGPATLATATRLLEETRAALAGGVTEVDLGEVTELDSSLLAVIFAWMREARAQGHTLALRRVPADLTSLARLYGVAELLPQDAR
ncbi:MAG TPA: STAS domain-containing protein [Burkholderiales bacterium]|nr:STAS domain-containing protein [Burkholderiales bacterium]